MGAADAADTSCFVETEVADRRAKEVAGALGIGPSILGNWESGPAHPRSGEVS